MNNIWAFILTLVNVDQVGLLFALLIADMLTGAIAAAVAGEFDWSKLSKIWEKVVLVYLAYLAVSVMSLTLVQMGWSNQWEIPRTAMCTYLSAQLVNAILANLAAMKFPVVSKYAKSIHGLLNRIPALNLLSRNLKPAAS